MSEHGYAFFVKRPRRIDELMCPHPIELEREFKVVKTIMLPTIDFENFVTDMVADRQFLGENANLCTSVDPIACLLVKSRHSTEGILVVPYNDWVEAAAVLPMK